MATSRRDVELVIKARDEATKAVNTVAKALEFLTKAQHDVASGAGDVGSSMGALKGAITAVQGAYAKIDKDADAASAAFERQKAALVSTKEEYAAVAAQIDAAKEALTRLRGQKAPDFIGPVNVPLVKAAEAAYRDLQSQSAKLTRDMSRQETVIDASRSALQQLGSTAIAAEQALDKLGSPEHQTALLAQAEAFERAQRQAEQYRKEIAHLASDEANRANDQFFGVTGKPSNSARESAAVFEAALKREDAELQRQIDLLDEAERQAAQYRQEISRLAAEENARRNTAGLDGSGKSARESAAVFEAAFAVENAAIKEQADLLHAAELRAESYREEISRLAAEENARLNTAGLGGSGKSARDSASVFEEAADAEDEMTAAAAALRAQLDPMAAVQVRLNAELTKARALYAAGKITAIELANAEKLLASGAEQAARALGKTPGGKGTFLGLRPYELTNLSYQINDVVTQLASGTKFTQVIAQQGGQFFQIFARSMQGSLVTLGRLIPGIGALLTAVLTLRAAMAQVADENESRRGFSAALLASADGADHQAASMARAAKELDLYGGSLDDARTAVAEFFKAGIQDGQIERFGRAAQDMARVFKITIPDAVKQTASAFNAGYDAIKKLDDGFNFLTAAEREHIKAMFDSGDAAGARTEAFRIFEAKMDTAAEKARGPWSKAAHDLGTAWNGFLTFLADTRPVQGWLIIFDQLAKAAEKFAAKLPGAQSGVIPDGSSPEIVRAEERLTQLAKERALAVEREAKAKVPRMGGGQDRGGRSVTEIDTDLANATYQRDLARGQLRDTINADSEKARKARQDVLDTLNRERDSLGDVTDAQKIRMAGEQAYQDEIRDSGDLIIANGKRQLAIDKEVERQRKAIDYGRLSTKIVGAESSGNPNATNGASTATGLGQFIETTWVSLFKKHFPTEAAKLTEDQILALRRDADISKKMIEVYAQENAKVLQAAGNSVTEANLYLAHFLGPQGALKILNAKPGAPVSGLLSPDAISANPRVLKDKTAGQVLDYVGAKVGQSDEQRAALSDQAAIQEKLNKDNIEFNQTLAEQNKGRREQADALAALAQQETLSIEARYEANKAGAIAAKIHEAETLALEKNQVLTEAQRKEITDSTAAVYELEHATAMHNEVLARNNDIVQEAINKSKELTKAQRDFISDTIGLEQQREALLQQLKTALSEGDGEEVSRLRAEIEALRLKLVETLPQALALAAALGDEKVVGGLERVQERLNTIGEQIVTAAQINEMLASGIVGAWGQVAVAIGQGENAVHAFADAFRQFAADFLRQIAAMILKAVILKLLTAALGGTSAQGGSGIGGFIADAINGVAGVKKHGGGIAGAGPTQIFPASLWNDMTRMHGGGVVGLRPDEIPAILQKNEEVLTASDPRHRWNGGGAAPAAPAVNLKVVNAIDAGDMVSQGAGTAVGERAILNLIRNNAAGVRTAIGVPG